MHGGTGQTYFDGTIFHNHPIVVAIMERQNLWPDEPCEFPDIILSIGTGTSTGLETRRSGLQPEKPHQGLAGLLANMYHLAKDRFESALNCNVTWDKFINAAARSWDISRLHRINPMLTGEVPALDDVKKMKSIQDDVRRTHNSEGVESSRLLQIAKRLIATSFYFQLSGRIKDREATGE